MYNQTLLEKLETKTAMDKEQSREFTLEQQKMEGDNCIQQHNSVEGWVLEIGGAFWRRVVVEKYGDSNHE